MTEFLINVVAFLSVLLVLVVVHELGHFVTAKMAGVTVQEFGFGYPPRLFAIKYKGTDYSLNILPLGGFVKLLGEENPKEEGSFASKGIRTRLIILGAGSFMNLLLPIVLLSASLMIPRETVVGPVRIDMVAAGSPAERAGLQVGDTILKINDREIKNIQDVGYNIQLNLGSEMEMTVGRDSGSSVVHVVPRWNPPPGQGATGITIRMPAELQESRRAALSPPEALVKGIRGGFDMLSLFKNGIYSLIAARSGPADTAPSGPPVAGPIGIAQLIGGCARAGLPTLLNCAAFLSMNLAILNILPIPALDGGRMGFVVLEWIRRGRRVSSEREGLVHLVGFAVLLGLIAIVSYNDIARILRGESLFP